MSLTSSSTSTDPTLVDGGANLRVGTKRKRTRRRRVHELHRPAPSCSSASSSRNCEKISATASTEEEEEEDNYMAYCLMLLSRDRPPPTDAAAAATATAAPAVTRPETETVYQCKTCNKTFPSFQALGGHRTSHTKQKPSVTTEPMTAASSLIQCELSLATAASKAKVHACSICGAEFTSGQALGGHMRRHRSAGSTAGIAESYAPELEEKTGMLLDLNAPPPQFGMVTFAFADEPQVVDCHY